MRSSPRPVRASGTEPPRRRRDLGRLPQRHQRLPRPAGTRRRCACGGTPRADRGGSVGGGTRMVCHGFKGGIGTSSRVVEEGWTLGVRILQANLAAAPGCGSMGSPSARRSAPTPCRCRRAALRRWRLDHRRDRDRRTSSPGPCERVARRAGFGIARTGGMGERSSGDFALCFATGNRGLVADEPEARAPDGQRHQDRRALRGRDRRGRGVDLNAARRRDDDRSWVAARCTASRTSCWPTRSGEHLVGIAGDERGVAAARGQQLLVRADLGDVTAVEHDDLVGVADGRGRSRSSSGLRPGARARPGRRAPSACRERTSPRRGRGSAGCAGSSARSRSAAARGR